MSCELEALYGHGLDLLCIGRFGKFGGIVERCKDSRGFLYTRTK